MPIKKNRKCYKEDNCSPGDIPKDVVDEINTYFTDIYLKPKILSKISSRQQSSLNMKMKPK